MAEKTGMAEKEGEANTITGSFASMSGLARGINDRISDALDAAEDLDETEIDSDPVEFEIAIVCNSKRVKSKPGDGGTVQSGTDNCDAPGAGPKTVPIAAKDGIPVQPNEEGSEDNPAVKPMDPVDYLVDRLEENGLVVERVLGTGGEEFIKVGAPLEVIGKMAEKLMLKKLTRIGIQAVFNWEHRNAYVRQPCNKELFSRTERFHCLEALIYGIRNETESELFLSHPTSGMSMIFMTGRPLVAFLKGRNVVKDVFPLHGQKARRDLLRLWSMSVWKLTAQPYDMIFNYFGPKVAIYYAFLGMYTRWLVFPTILGIVLHVVGRWSTSIIVSSIFSVFIILWAVVFLQFWKRRNNELLAKWDLKWEDDELHSRRPWEDGGLASAHDSDMSITCSLQEDLRDLEKRQKRALMEDEWRARFHAAKNNFITVFGVLCVHMPWEVAYLYLDKQIKFTPLKILWTLCYLLVIQNLTKIGGRAAVVLNKSGNHVSKEAEADSLVFKIFLIHFMQNYVGLFCHSLYWRDFKYLRSEIQTRLIMAQVLDNFVEVFIPYLEYRYKKYKKMKDLGHSKKEIFKSLSKKKAKERQRVEKEFLMPSYVTQIGDTEFDAMFDEFLELAVQFGTVTMFASTFPLIGLLTFVGNLIEIRSDSFKMLQMYRRPVPHSVASIGSWLTIFQYFGVVSIISNCALIMLMYDKDREWKADPVLITIVLLEHLLLLMRLLLAWFVPEEPSWLKVRRMKNRRAQQVHAASIVRDWHCSTLMPEALVSQTSDPSIPTKKGELSAAPLSSASPAEKKRN